MRRAVVLLLLLALAAPCASAGPGNPRSPDLATASAATTVTALAMASESGSVLIGTTDPGSELPTGAAADLATFFLYNSAGQELASGSADHPDCVLRLLDMCKSPVLSAALSASGSRFAVAASVSQSIEDDTRSILHLGSPSAGIVLKVPFSTIVTNVTFSADGTTLGIVTRTAPAGGTPVYAAQLYTWDGSADPAHLVGLHASNTIGAAPRSVVVDATGARMLIGADKFYTISKTTGTLVTSTITGVGNINSVAAFDKPPYVVVGSDKGNLMLFNSSAFDPTKPEPLPKPTGATNLVSVAASPDSYVFAGGDASGNLYLYRRTPESSSEFGKPITTTKLSGAVRDVAFAAGGSLLTARVGSDVQMFLLRDDKLVPLWTENVAGATMLRGRANGDQQAVAFGASVRVLEAKHSVHAADVPLEILPKLSKIATLRYENDGNRPESIVIGQSFPDGWFVQPTTDKLAVDPGQHADLDVKVVAAAGATPGVYPIYINHTSPTGANGATKVLVTIPSVSRLLLFDDGPTSLGIKPGEVAAFSVLVTNAGNVPAKAVFKAAVDNTAWGGGIAKPSVDLAPGQEEHITVQVTAPSNAGQGDAVHITISLEGLPDQKVSFTATVGARFGIDLQAPINVAIRPGNQTNVALTVKNLGNAPDGVALTLFAKEIPAGYRISFVGGLPTVTLKGIAAGTTQTAQLLIQVPEDAPSGAILNVRVQATSEADGSQRDVSTIQVSIGDKIIQPSPKKGSPDAGVAFLTVALLGLAAFMGRGRAA